MAITRRRMMAAVAVCVSWSLLACEGGGTSSSGGDSMPADKQTARSPSASPTNAPPTNATRATMCARRTLDKLGLEQRVGQLFMGGMYVDRLSAPVPSALAQSHVGSILLVGEATDGVDAVARAVERARDAVGSPAGARPLVAVDQEGGSVQHLTGPGFSRMPSAHAQAAMTPARLRRAARAWAHDLRAAEIDLNLAPVADVVPASIGDANQPIGALERGYGSRPAKVSEYVAAFVTGMKRAGVSTAVKHFPGLGKVRGNTDFSGGVVDTRTARRDPDLAPFHAGIEAGSRFLMVSLATYADIDPGNRAAFSPTVVEEMVRRDLSFDGVVISDDLGAAQEVADVPPARRALNFLGAGGDIVVTAAPAALPEMTRAVVMRARSEPSFRAEVDRHALRVLTAKQRMGLLACPPPG